MLRQSQDRCLPKTICESQVYPSLVHTDLDLFAIMGRPDLDLDLHYLAYL